MTRPPLAATVWPVMKLDSSLSKKRITAAISSGVPSRPSGVCSTTSRLTSGGSTWATATTVVPPGSAAWAANTSQGRMVGDYISTSFVGGNPVGIFGNAKAPTTGTGTSCTTTALDNCRVPISATGSTVTAGALTALGDPVLFSGNGGTGAQNLWNLVDNNGSKHRD